MSNDFEEKKELGEIGERALCCTLRRIPKPLPNPLRKRRIAHIYYSDAWRDFFKQKLGGLCGIAPYVNPKMDKGGVDVIQSVIYTETDEEGNVVKDKNEKVVTKEKHRVTYDAKRVGRFVKDENGEWAKEKVFKRVKDENGDVVKKEVERYVVEKDEIFLELYYDPKAKLGKRWSFGPKDCDYIAFEVPTDPFDQKNPEKHETRLLATTIYKAGLAPTPLDFLNAGVWKLKDLLVETEDEAKAVNMGAWLMFKTNEIQREYRKKHPLSVLFDFRCTWEHYRAALADKRNVELFFGTTYIEPSVLIGDAKEETSVGKDAL